MCNENYLQNQINPLYTILSSFNHCKVIIMKKKKEKKKKDNKKQHKLVEAVKITPKKGLETSISLIAKE